MNVPVKLRLSTELHRKLQTLHPGYGELQQVMRELLEGYVQQVERGRVQTLRQQVAKALESTDGKV